MTYLQSRRKRSARRRSTSRRQHTYRATAEAGLKTKSWAPPQALRWIPSALLAAACVGLLILFFAGGRFYITAMEAEGCALISAAELAQASGIRGWNAFYVREHEVEDRLLSAYPALRAATVRCRLPNQVKITVQERTPEVVWQADNGRFWVDEEGVVLKPADSLGDMVLIKDGDRTVAKSGDRLNIAPAVTTAQALAQLLGEAKVFAYTQDKGIILQHSSASGDRYEVYFGVGEDVAAKVANMEALIREVEDGGYRNVDYLDVRFNQMAIGFQGQ